MGQELRQQKLREAVQGILVGILVYGIQAMHAAPVFLVALAYGVPWWAAVLVGLLFSHVMFAGFAVSYWFFDSVLGIGSWLVMIPASIVGSVVWFCLWTGMLMMVGWIADRLAAVAPILSRMRATRVPMLRVRKRGKPGTRKEPPSSDLPSGRP